MSAPTSGAYATSRSSRHRSRFVTHTDARAKPARPDVGADQRRLRHVAELLRLGERAQLLQRLVLDLADALAGDVERAADLVERARGLAVQAEAHLDHAALALAEHLQRAAERLVPQRQRRPLVGERLRLILDEVPELRLLVVADRFLEGYRRLRGAADLLDLLDGHLELKGDLERARLPAALGAQLALGAQDLVQLLDDVHGHADRAALVGERARDGLADPPRRVGGELEPLSVVELLRGADEADRPLLDQVEEGQALVAVALGDRDDEPEVRLDHLLLGAVVAALDALRELDLLRGGEQVDLADVLQKELQRVGRDLELDGILLVERRAVDRLNLLDLVVFVGVVDSFVDIVEKGPVRVLRHRSLSPSSPAPTWRMRNSCKRAGRTCRPDGSFVRAVGPTSTHPIDELFRAPAELGRRPERVRALALGERLVAPGGRGEHQAEVEAHHLAAGETSRQRPEPGEGCREVVLVEPPDGGGDLRLGVVRGEPRRPQVDALRRVLVTLRLEPRALLEEVAALERREDRIAAEVLRMQDVVGRDLPAGVAAELLRLLER